MTMLKIAFLTQSLEAGGAERAVITIADEIRKLGHEIYLITGKNVDEDFYDVPKNIKRLHLNFNYQKVNYVNFIKERLTRIIKLRNTIKKINPDVLISVSTDTNILSIISMIGESQKIIAWEHNNYHAVKSIKKRILRLLTYKYARKIILLTNRDINNYPLSLRKRVEVIQNPVGIKPNENQVYKSASDEIRLLIVGRLTEQKGHDRLPEILKQLEFNYRLSIVGDGHLKEKIENKFSDYKLSDTTEFLGQVRDMDSIYKNNDILLMTSYYEGLPMVIREANAFGLPVIAYDCPTGPAELIKSDINGWIIEDNDSNAFATKLNKYGKDKKLRREIFESTIKESDSNSNTKIAEHWIKLLKSL